MRGEGGRWNTTDEVQFMKHLGEFSLLTNKPTKVIFLSRYLWAIRERQNAKGDPVNWQHVREVGMELISQYDLGREILAEEWLRIENTMRKVGEKIVPKKTAAEVWEEIR